MRMTHQTSKVLLSSKAISLVLLLAVLRPLTGNGEETPAINIVGEFLATFKEYPPSQASGTFTVEKALTAMQEGTLKN